MDEHDDHQSKAAWEGLGENVSSQLQSLFAHANLDEADVSFTLESEVGGESTSPRLAVTVTIPNRVLYSEIVETAHGLLNSMRAIKSDDRSNTEFICAIPPTLTPSDWNDSASLQSFVLRVCVNSGRRSNESKESQLRLHKDPFEAIPDNSTSATETEAAIDMPTRIKSLLLSGGGYRAAAFHIGVVRWLYEHSQTEKGECALKGIEHVVGVSGGAITAAHLVTHFNDYCDGFTAALRLLTFLCEKSLRKAALNRKAPMSIERHLSDWKWNDFPELRWEEDQGPSLHILGTGCNTGDQIVFEKTTIMRQSIDELQADAAASTSHATISKTNCPVSSAIAASAAFPPMLMPFRISKDSVNSDTQQEVAEFGEVEVADGGIIDNTGLAFSLCQGWGRDRSSILVSDAGKPFDWSTESLSVNSVASWFNRMDRAVSHIYRQCDRLMMHPSSRCHKVSISNSGHFKAREKVIDEYNHALDRAVALRVKDIQTDLDSLSRSEAFALVRMGYDLAGARLSAAYPVRIRKDNFFKGLWPSAELKGEATLVDAVGASISARQRERASLFTLYSSAPLKRWLMWALVIVLLLSLVGTWSILSYFWQIAFPEETVIEPMA